MIRIAVCDDNDIQRDILLVMIRSFIRETDASFVETEEYSNPVELLDAVKSGIGFDICFLDIVMPEMQGIDLAKEIREITKKTKLIFCSSSAEYVFQSFQTNAFDYLVKPVDVTKLCSVLERAINAVMDEKEREEMDNEELVDSITHEFKTPLSVISGYAQMMNYKLKDSESNPEVKNNITGIIDETQKLGKLIQKISRNKQGKE